MFYDMDAFANEYVFFMTKSKDQAWQGDIYPPSREGSSRQQPVQEQVDEYEYIVGDYGYPVYSAEARKGAFLRSFFARYSALPPSMMSVPSML